MPLLHRLEVLRDLHRIPDTRPDEVLARVEREITRLSPAARRRLTELAAAQARAVLGALLERLADSKGAATLRTTLNPLTTYCLGLSAAALPNRAAWNIQ